jgi:hypothetical protein
MINTMVTCLSSEHRRLDDQLLQLALAATRFAGDCDALTRNQRAVEIWDEIRGDLWSHLQIEDELVFSWGQARHAISSTLLNTLQSERQEIRKLVVALTALPSNDDRQRQTAANRAAFAHTLLALAQTLNSHIERYEGEVLPLLRRALFRKKLESDGIPSGDSEAFNRF